MSWEHQEANGLGSSLPRFRRITVGTTLAIDMDRRVVRAVLTTNPEHQKKARTAMLRRLEKEAILDVGFEGSGAGSRMRALVAEDSLRVVHATSMLF